MLIYVAKRLAGFVPMLLGISMLCFSVMALAPGSPVDLRIFAKPSTLPNRRMGIALARSASVEDALARATSAASRVKLRYEI